MSSTYQKQLEWSRNVSRRNNELSKSMELQKDKEHANMFKPRTSHGNGARMRVVDEGGRSKDQKSLHVHRQEKARLEKSRVHQMTTHKKHHVSSHTPPSAGALGNRTVSSQQPAVRLVNDLPAENSTPGSTSGNTGGYRAAYEEEQQNPTLNYNGGEDEGE
mmetsp:Transcript_12080/g.21932  ORF Transcript_12080/g.21932 Transcript_12080/m.21932 type:complete len:161 (+) Transcript_12080:60-542(+)